MNFNKLASKIAKKEGRKHQASVGDVREILSLVSKEMAKCPMVIAMLIKNGSKKK